MADRALNYDQFASSFDSRYKVCSYAGVRAALVALVHHDSIGRALEVGCGTGHWLRELGSVGVVATGLDLSHAMLRRAYEKDGQAWLICGSASQLPFAEAEFDLVYCVNAFHHFSQPERFLAEAARVLKTGGVLALIGLDPHQPDTNWYLYDYFEGVREWDRTRYCPTGRFAAWLEKANFRSVSSTIVEHFSHTWYADEVWEDPFLKKESTSQLMALSQKEYAAGLERIRRVIAGTPGGRPPTFPVQLSLVMTTGIRN